jgi:hypothetical protein
MVMSEVLQAGLGLLKSANDLHELPIFPAKATWVTPLDPSLKQ